MTESSLERTALWDLHLANAAKMVPFAGYEMPLQYGGMGVLAEHTHTRNQASLFDIAHMGVIEVRGSAAAQALEKVLPTSLVDLAPGAQRYSFFTTEQGGMLDDVIVGNDGEYFTLVVNASRKREDLHYLNSALEDGVVATDRADLALIAVQGPAAERAVSRLLSEAAELKFMQARTCRLEGFDVRLSRSGYTGEDGFELAVPKERALALSEMILVDPSVHLAGLGARDTLRLEAGLCLYGSDIDESTSPIEAALQWAIPKRRRQEGGYPGDELVRKQIGDGTSRRRVGLAPKGRRPVRSGTILYLSDGQEVGKVTSGSFGPTLGAPVSMGYVRSDLTEPGSLLQARVGTRVEVCEVVALPFVPHRYRRG